MNDNRRTFLKDAIIGATGLTLGSMTSGGCSSIPSKSEGKCQNQYVQEPQNIDSTSGSKIKVREASMNVDSPMKSILVLISYHHKNTEKIAKVFAKVLDAQIKKPQQISIEELSEYGLIGFGSGIYDQKHHKYILDLADKLPEAVNRKVFIFSTSGISRKFALKYPKDIDDPHKPLKEKLSSKGYIIVDEFNCAGWNTNSFLKLFGGLNRGKPNAEDLKNAEEFAQNLLHNV